MKTACLIVPGVAIAAGGFAALAAGPTATVEGEDGRPNHRRGVSAVRFGVTTTSPAQ
jgi:hypothetical protein